MAKNDNAKSLIQKTINDNVKDLTLLDLLQLSEWLQMGVIKALIRTTTLKEGELTINDVENE